MEKYIMALDQGTTSSRCILYNHSGEVISMAQKEVRQIYPHDGWVEQNPMEIWSTQMGVAQEALLKINGTYKNIAAIGITNQRETTILWDKTTGEPVYNAIVWQCRRTANICDDLKAQGYTSVIAEKTGLLLDSYFSATKLKWILDKVPGAREKAEDGQLLFGTVETWILWKLTNGNIHATDYSNASRTMMFNINTLQWDDELLKLLNIPKQILPKPVGNSQIYGMTEGGIFGGEVPISGMAGDQQASLFGQTCFAKKEGKMTYGTGGFMLMNIGNKPVFSKNGLLTTIAWEIDKEINYALEGSVFIAGAAVQWLRDELQIINKASDSESLAFSVDDSGGVFFVPALVGLGAPYWDPYARGTIIGLTRNSNKSHIVRATLESLAYQTKDLVDAMIMDIGEELETFRVDGGASANNFLMQFQSDILNQPVFKAKSPETTSLGAGYLAGLAVGYWKDKEDIKNHCKNTKIFFPSMNQDRRNQLLDSWHKAIQRSMAWINE